MFRQSQKTLRIKRYFIGEEFVRLVEMLFCDLCHKYLHLPRMDEDRDIQSVLNEHCLAAGHQTAYYKYKEHHKSNDRSENSSDIENQKVSIDR